MTDQHFESGMGSHDKDYGSSRNEEGMESGQVQNQPMTSNRENEFGMVDDAKDVAPSSNEEGMGATVTDRAADHSGNNYGMGSGRPQGEEGMDIIPGQHHHKSEHEEKEGAGLEGKIEGLIHKK